ncbi:MAG: two component LuxR family transcriptional regulator [Herminiimonas sp.]|nr:two component LuxR family transcriptional regulator [Herminiimonas sp.]
MPMELKMIIHKIKILLVDDHEVVRNGMRQMLGSASDIEVTGEAETAEQALRLAKEQDFNVALIDINLPDMHGLELLKQLRKARPMLAVLVLSMYSESIYALRAYKFGASGYLTKNSTAETMVAGIRKVAAGGRYVSAAMAEKLAGMIDGVSLGAHEFLSDRELEVLKMIAAGESLVQIGKALHLSASTVTTYRTRILGKMGLKNNAELTRYAFENGLLE